MMGGKFLRFEVKGKVGRKVKKMSFFLYILSGFLNMNLGKVMERGGFFR